MKNVFIAIPIHRNWSRESETYLKKNISRPSSVWKLQTLACLYEESLIQRARHNLMLQFLESKADYLFFMDDDIVMISEDTIETLVKSNKDIIGGVYIMKKPPHVPVIMPFEPEYPNILSMTQPFKVRYTGCGCMLISRKCVEKVSTAFKYPFECYETEIEKILNGEVTSTERIYLSEDWAFCDRANSLGFSTWIHPLPVLGHLGTYAFSLRDWYNMKEIQ